MSSVQLECGVENTNENNDRMSIEHAYDMIDSPHKAY
jgi:hypothetical protein